MNHIERAQNIFRETFDIADLVLQREQTANDIEGWDSLAHVRLILALEKEFKIKFKMSEIVSLKNVGEMLDTLERKLLEKK